MTPFELNQLTLEQQVLTLHSNGVYIGTLDMPEHKVNLCYLDGYFAEIYCREEHGHSTPYSVNYYPNSLQYINLLSRNLDDIEASELIQSLKEECF